MPPDLAVLIWFVLLVALFVFDPAKDPEVSSALWVPVIWMFFSGSRLPSQWLAGNGVALVAGSLEEGNPIDRAIFSLLILVAVAILFSRSFKLADFLIHNLALTAFLAFALISVLWSDFPFVSFKRWVRDLGNYAVILVTLSDRRPIEAVCTVVRRLCYLLIPLSILLIKYFPVMGRAYSEWTGQVTYYGVTPGKDLLGMVCQISVIFFFWDITQRWHDRKIRRTKYILLIDAAFIGMTLWLMNLADCATCDVCLVIGCLVMILALTRWAKRHSTMMEVLIPTVLALCVALILGLNLIGSAAGAVGRNSTLTGRTDLWNDVLEMHTNPLVGTGYEGFWLGPRLDYLWARHYWRPNQAHNGYIEVYLNLGWIGLSLIIIFLLSSYLRICKRFSVDPGRTSLFLTLWTMTLLFNITDADFAKGELMWLVFLMGVLSMPALVETRIRPSLFPAKNVQAKNRRFMAERPQVDR